MHPCRSACLSISLFLLVAQVADGALSTMDPFVRCEAEDWNLAYGISINACTYVQDCDYYAGNINNGDLIVFDQMDFQDGATFIRVRVAADQSKNDQVGELHLHADNITNPPFCTIVIGNTGDLEAFVTIAQFIEYPPVGVHDVIFSFTTPFATSDIGNIDWFQFSKVGGFSSYGSNSGSMGGFSSYGSNSGSISGKTSGRGVSKSAFDKIQASEWDYQNGIINSECIDKNQCDYYVGYIQRDDVLVYYGVDFQDGATGLVMALGANVLNDAIGSIDFRLDNAAAYPFATVVTGNTGGEQTWAEVKQFIEYAPAGVHDLYFTFNCNNNSDIGNIAWFQFFKVQ